MTLVPDQIARWVPGDFSILGTDGYGRSDSRQALRRFFEVGTGHIVAAALSALAKQDRVSSSEVRDAFDRYHIDPEAVDPARAH